MTEAEILAALKKILFPPSSMFDETGQERILDYQINPDGTISVAARDGIKQIGALIDVDKGRIKSRILNPEQVDPTYKKEFAAVALAIEVWEMTGVLPVDELATFAAKGSKSATPKQCKKQRCGNSCISVNKICQRNLTAEEKLILKQIKATGKKAPASKIKTQPKPQTPKPVGDGFPIDPSDLSNLGGLGGSTGAQLVQDSNGNKFIKKTGANPGQIKDEHTSDSIYRALGIDTPEGKLYDTPDGPVKLTKFVDGTTLNNLPYQGKQSQFDEAFAKLQKDFAVDALLGNWDVIGMSGDNIMLGDDGKVYRIDNGGSLRYRAMGGNKGAAWNDVPAELFSMRDSSVNKQSAQAFGPMSYKEVMGQAGALAKRKAEVLKAVGDPDLQKTLSARLDAMGFLSKNHDSLVKKGVKSDTIESFHKSLVEQATAGVPLPKTAAEATNRYQSFIGTPANNPPGAKINPKKVLTESEVKQLADKAKDDSLDQPLITGKAIRYWEGNLADQKWKTENNAPPPPPPSAAEIGAINTYSGAGYNKINVTLRGLSDPYVILTPTQKEMVIETAKLATSGMRQLPSASVTSYRGVDLKPEHLAKYVEGETYQEPAFASTAKTEAKAWSGNTFFIYQPKTKDGLGKDITQFSNYPSEQEVLYPPGSKFRVVKKHLGANFKKENGTIYENLIVLQEI